MQIEIASGVYQVHDIFVNCYILLSDAGVSIIDTGLARTTKLILASLNQLGFKAIDIQMILITHADGDHIGGLANLQRMGQAQTLASQVEADAVREGKSSRPLKPKGAVRILYNLVAPLFRSEPGRIDNTLSNGQFFPVLGGLKVLNTPGHTPGHVSFFVPGRGILFAGDSINLEKGQPVPSKGANTWDQVKADESFELQMALKPQVICAGHCTWFSGQ